MDIHGYEWIHSLVIVFGKFGGFDLAKLRSANESEPIPSWARELRISTIERQPEPQNASECLRMPPFRMSMSPRPSGPSGPSGPLQSTSRFFQLSALFFALLDGETRLCSMNCKLTSMVGAAAGAAAGHMYNKRLRLTTVSANHTSK